MEHDAQVCRSCGNLLSECSDPERDWHPDVATCYATAARQWGQRTWQEMHAKTEVGPDQLHPLDGTAVFASQTPPPEGQDPFA